MKNHTMRLAGILTLSWVASTAHAQFTVTQVGAGATATGINSTGQVTGWSGAGSFVTGANGVGMTLLGSPPGQGGVSYAQGINDTGQVAGYFVTWAGVEHAFATSANGALMVDLGILGGSTSSAASINNSGQVVGFSSTNTPYVYHAFISGSTGGMTDLGGSYAFGINSAGQVAGDNAAGHAFLTGRQRTGHDGFGDYGWIRQ